MIINLFNANGLACKAEEICQFNSQMHINLTFILETWLAPTASVPFRPHISNVTNTITEAITGGRRNHGGILVFANDLKTHQNVRVLFQDNSGCYVAVEILDVIVIAVYLSPSQPNSKLTEILDKAADLSDNFSKRCVVLGDLNARLAELGDSITNTRGRFLRDELDNYPLEIQLPMEGKWTTFAGGGCGITDLVLANFNIQSIVVHEKESLGGSDHRPLTFTLEVDDLVEDRNFKRWNVRKLAKAVYQEQYQQLLSNSYQAILNQLQQIQIQLQNAVNSQKLIDQSWDSVKSWMSSAAITSIGVLHYHNHMPQDFWTEELEQERDRVQTAVSSLQENVVAHRHSSQALKEQAIAVTQLQQTYRVSLKQRRTVLFENAVDNLAIPQNAGSFMRMIRGAQSRRSRTGCKLDPSQLDVHAQYYLNTFGGAPAGNHLEQNQSTLWTFKSTEELVTSSTIRTLLSQLPFGKAAGPDQIPAELLAKGGDSMIQVLTLFLQMVHTCNTIPSEWRKVLIVPVYKKKGADSEIANYRPISLTCTARRLYERLLLLEIHPIARKLCDAQGGFRKHRSTLDQAMVLHEALSTVPTGIAALLDLKTAYDVVNRTLLWNQLEKVFGISGSMLSRLQDLFDHNSSQLVVSGKISAPIANTRGLMQGSSLSPSLFNFFIDGLNRRLDIGPKIQVHGVLVNALLFADDTALVAGNHRDMRTLLKTCEQWSLDMGMQFAPAKCVLLGPQPHQREVPLQLYLILL